MLALFGLWGAPPDAVQGDAQRLMYLHVPAAWLAYLAFGVTALASALWLWPRTRADGLGPLAGASAELGVMFTGLTLVLGSLWGRPVWGIWWAWDARLITTAVLFFLYLGYLALRRIRPTPEARGEAVRDRRAHRVRRRADRALLGDLVADAAPAGHGVQPAARREDPRVMAFTLWFGVLAFTLLYVYLLDRRYQLARARGGPRGARGRAGDRRAHRVAQAGDASVTT